jgi:hypothetical protein
MEWEKIAFSDGVLEINAKSWHGFVEYIQNELSNYRAYIYRGQREPEWKLTPSISRIEGIRTLKVNTLEEFKQASRGRRGLSPPKLNGDEWWAIGQHHGLKTPLLDWTESPFIAAFFAFASGRANDDLPKSRIVYAIAYQQIKNKCEEIKKHPILTGAATSLLTGFDAIDIISPQIDDNARLVSQRGLFTKSLGGGLCHNIESWMRKNFKGNDGAIMIKIVVIENLGDRNDFLRFLNRMNINYLTLFPDLDGAARHCNMQLEIDNY